MNDLVIRFKSLADENRLSILEILLSSDLCVRALAHRLGISESSVSQHLQTLRKAGLVKGEKRGYWTHYSVQREALREMAEKLTEIADRPKPIQPFRIEKMINKTNDS